MLFQTSAILDQAVQAEKGDISPFKRSFLLKQFGVNYRGSPMILDERTKGVVVGHPYSNDDGRICAGDRAPDAPGLVNSLGEQTKLFDLFRPWLHTVLIFGHGLEVASPILRALGRYPDKTIQAICIVPKGTTLPVPPLAAETILEDRGGYAYMGYAVDKANNIVVVVRPDGVIGAIVFGVEGAEEYFDGIFDA
jgi:hypothetical protein